MTEPHHPSYRPHPEPAPEPWETGPGLLEAIWRYRWLVLITTLIAAGVGFAASFLQATMYEGEARLFLADPRNSGVFRDETRIVIDPSRYVRNQASFIESTPVLIRASELSEITPDLDTLERRVTASPAADSDVITIRALDPSAQGAAALTNSVAEAYQQLVREETMQSAEASLTELEQSMADLRTEIAELESQLGSNPDNGALQAQRDAAVAQLVNLEQRAEQIAVDAALYGSGVELFEEAGVPEEPVQPQPLRNAAIAGILGLMAASAYAWWRAEQTQVADERHDPAPILGAPLLGEVPVFEEVGGEGPVPTVSSPGSTLAEAYHFIMSSLQFALDEWNAKSVLITSPGPADGKTVTTLNLAIAAARDEKKLLLLDADERMRGLTQMRGPAADAGLTDLALEDLPVESATRAWRLSEKVAVPFIPAGTKLKDTAGFFRTPGFKRAIDKIVEQAELVLVDSPPILAVADTSAIATHVDGIVLVVTRGTPLRVLEDVRNHLSFVGTPLLGYIFNRSQSHRSRYGKYGSYGSYGYGYGYGQSDDGKAAGDRRSARARRLPASERPRHSTED